MLAIFFTSETSFPLIYLCHHKFTNIRQPQGKENILYIAQSYTKPLRCRKLSNDSFILKMKLLFYRGKKRNPSTAKS